MLRAIIIAFGVSFAAFLGFIGFYMIFTHKKTSKRELNKKNNNTSYKFRETYKRVALVIYKLAYTIAPLFVENWNYYFKMSYILSETESRIRTAETLLLTSVTVLITGILSLNFMGDTMLALIITIMITMYVLNKLKGDGIKFLESLQDTLEDMVHLYNANNENIDGMFNSLLENRQSYVYRYMEQMYDTLKRAIIDESNSEEIIMKYNQDVPSRHLRLMFNYLYMTYRYGDEVLITGERLFNRNMLALQREINADLTRVKEIKAGTLGEQWFIIGAVIMIPNATWYMKEFFTFENFETIGRFLDGTIGYAIKLFCAVYSLLTYYIYMKILESGHALETRKSIYWEELLLRIKPINKMVSIFAPEKGTERYEKILTKISMVDGYNGIKPFYLRKVITSIAVFIACLFLLSCDTILVYQQIENDLYRGVSSDTMDMVLKMEEFPDAYKAKALSNDDAVMTLVRQDIDEYNKLSASSKKEYILNVISENDIDYGMYPDVAADRIMEKLATLSKVRPEMMVIIAIVVMVVGYWVPNITLNMTLLLSRRAMIEDEIIGYYTVVILLVNHSASNIYMMLNWMKNFADIYKVRFQRCLDNLSERELISMKTLTANKELNRLIDSMLLAFRGTDLKSAFAGIEQTYEFQENARRLINQRIIQYRVTVSEWLSWSAMGITFVLYILAPMIYSIWEMLAEVMTVG